MKALSTLQPWAWLIVHGYKDIENRRWRSAFRGRFLVHAGQRWGREQREDLAFVRARFPQIVMPDRYDLGGIVGAATMTDCVRDHPSPWYRGDWGFVLEQGVPCEFVPYRGQLNFFDIPLQVLDAQFPCADEKGSFR